MKFGTRWPPVPAGILIGISMLLAWLVAGRGVGASHQTGWTGLVAKLIQLTTIPVTIVP